MKVAEADSEDACRAALWDVPFAGKCRDVVVLREGIDPNRRRLIL